MGQRHWFEDGTGIVNGVVNGGTGSGGMKIEFTPAQKELWVRWYMRYQAGFKWNPLVADKWLYFHPGEPHAVVPEWYSDEVNVWSLAQGNHRSLTNNGWSQVMGGSVSDGKWHFYEVHLKMDTNGADGVAEVWIDGTKKLTATDVDYGTQAGWSYFVIGHNKGVVSNGVPMAIDFDDFVVSSIGPIGPFPMAPKTLQVK